MSGEVKLRAKALLNGDTLRLFFVSVISLLLRRGALGLFSYVLYFFIKNDVIGVFTEKYNSLLVYFIAGAGWLSIVSVIILFVCALRMGEAFIYYMRASGGKGRISLLFHFFTFKKSFRAFSLLFRLFLLKLLWLLYYIFPGVICFGITFYLYFYGNLLPAVFYILLVGSSVLLSLCIFIYRVTVFRYRASVFYLCLEPELSPEKAIEKSAFFTDGFLREGILLESSFVGWFLSCFFVLPIVYVLPYFKLSGAVLVIEAINKKAYSVTKTEYAVNFIFPKTER